MERACHRGVTRRRVLVSPRRPRSRPLASTKSCARRSKRRPFAVWCNGQSTGSGLSIGASPEIGLKDARDLARAAHLQIASGEDPGAAKQAARTATKALPARDMVEKVAAQFLARHVKNLAAATRIEVGRIIAKEILPTFRGRRLSEIRRPDVVEWLDSIVDRPLPSAANRAMGWLKGLCHFAVARGFPVVSPVA